MPKQLNRRYQGAQSCRGIKVCGLGLKCMYILKVIERGTQIFDPNWILRIVTLSQF